MLLFFRYPQRIFLYFPRMNCFNFTKQFAILIHFKNLDFNLNFYFFLFNNYHFIIPFIGIFCQFYSLSSLVKKKNCFSIKNK